MGSWNTTKAYDTLKDLYVVIFDMMILIRRLVAPLPFWYYMLQYALDIL